MRDTWEPFDCDGNRISTGDEVVYVHASEGLLRGLADEDQAAIVAHVGDMVKIVDIDELGRVELEFEEEDDEPGCSFYRTI